MQASTIITKKRDGRELSEEEVRFLINGYVSDEIPDFQISAFLMAVYFAGMSAGETGYLTSAMLESGDVIDLSGVKGPLIDKHSTGGVGDKVSLILAPLAAACGLRVPMMSGRSLGHTGGTLDKLESIPGYRTDLSIEAFRRAVEEVGYGMTGQSERIAPADRKMYALRDVTATVESIPLITASILSKKIAEGAEGFVFDVKTGSGAFMKRREDAEALARSLKDTGESLGRKVTFSVTDMSEPLGRMVGNFLEVKESVLCLQGEGPPDLIEITLHLTAKMLVLGSVCASIADALELCRRKLEDGSAWERFLRNVEIQGGDVEMVRHPEKGPRASLTQSLLAEGKGYVQGIDAYTIGSAATLLGAGRLRREDDVLPGVGIEFRKKKGDAVEQGDLLCMVYADDRARLDTASPLVEEAFRIGSEAPAVSSLILDTAGSR